MFKIENRGEGQSNVYTPYSSDFVQKIKKNIGGAAWDNSKKCWVIPTESADICRNIMRSVYGQCDIPDADGYVKLKLTFNSEVSNWHDDVTMFGKCICKAHGRDSGGKPGADVSYISGEPQSGGSVKNWYSVVPEGAVIILSNVPAGMWNAYCESDTHNNNVHVELVDDTPDREKLINERKRLLARVAEIDDILGEN